MTDDTPPTLDCGRTVDELSDYLTAGRVPADPHIESCPDCLNTLDALERIGSLSRTLIDDDAQRLPTLPETWYDDILDTIKLELRAGRSIPLRHPDPHVTLSVTEGAVRALIRSTGDTVDGVYIARTEIDGDAETLDAPVAVNIGATVAWDTPLHDVADTIRRAVHQSLATHTELNITAINVTIEDVHLRNPGEDTHVADQH